MAPLGRTIPYVVALLACGMGSACIAAESRAVGAPVVLTDQSPNAVNVTRSGQPVEIRLRSQPGTGFLWVPIAGAKFVTALQPMSGQAIPGGWQTQRFLFVARRAGTYRVTFSYDRPWEGGTKGAKRRSFTIRVR